MSAELWRELHLNALHYKGTDDSTYLTDFGKKIPRYAKGCMCREHWYGWVRLNPAVYIPEGSYFEWTVRSHNNVNIKLGKPVMDVDDAKKLYSDLI